MSTNEIWERFRAELLGFIRSRVKDQQTADDLLQEVFVKIHLKKDSLRENTKLSAWVYQITRNVVNDFYRENSNKSFVSDFPQLQNNDFKPNTTIDFNQCIKPFIDELEPKYKDALLQTSIGNVSQKEYAQQLQISYSGAKSRVQRARHMVKELFLKCCPVVTDKYGNVIDGGKCSCSC